MENNINPEESQNPPQNPQRIKKRYVRGQPPPDWKERFIEALAKYGVLTLACEAACCHHSTAYDHRDKDPEFAADWNWALYEFADRIENEVYRRALDVERKSDLMLIFSAKAVRPEKFRENPQLAAFVERLAREHANREHASQSSAPTGECGESPGEPR